MLKPFLAWLKGEAPEKEAEGEGGTTEGKTELEAESSGVKKDMNEDQSLR